MASHLTEKMDMLMMPVREAGELRRGTPRFPRGQAVPNPNRRLACGDKLIGTD